MEKHGKHNNVDIWQLLYISQYIFSNTNTSSTIPMSFSSHFVDRQRYQNLSII